MKKLFIPIIFFLALATGFVFATEANAGDASTTALDCDVYTYQDKYYFGIGKYCIDMITIKGIYFVAKNQTTGIKSYWEDSMLDIFLQIKNFYESQFNKKIQITIDTPVVIYGDKNIEEYTQFTIEQEIRQKIQTNTTNSFTALMVYPIQGENDKRVVGDYGGGGGVENGSSAMNSWFWLDPENLGTVTTKYGTNYSGYLGSAHEFGHALGIPHPWAEEVNQDSSGNIINPDYGNDEIGSIMSYTGQSGPLIPNSFIRNQVKEKMMASYQPQPLSAPTLAYPINNSTVTVSNFIWNIIPEATFYEYKVWNKENLTELIVKKTIESTGSLGTPDGGSAFYYSDKGLFVYGGSTTELNDKSIYQWQVRACGGTVIVASDTICGLWSDVWTFTKDYSYTTNNFSSPILILPEDNTIVSLPFFTIYWSPVAGVKYYNYFVSYDGETVGGVSGSTEKTSKEIDFSEKSGTYKFIWKIAACDEMYNCGPWSETRTFTWIRQPLKSGDLVKSPSDPTVYVIKDGKKQPIASPQEFEQSGYKWDQIQTVTSDEISQIPDYTSDQKVEGIYPNGTLIKSENSPTVYIIINGKKRPIPDPATFNNWGLKWDQIKEVPSGTTADFSEITIPSDIVRAQGNDKIYRIIGDKKLWIPTIQAFLGSGYKPNSEIDISQDELSDFEDVKYIKAKGGTYVYEIKENKKYRITNTSQIPAQDIKPVTLAEFTAYPIGK